MDKIKKPWPTKDAMEQVYDLNLWGSNNTEFYSGEGSHKQEIVQPYIEHVQQFLKSFNQKITILDLGCGDFNVGKQLVNYTSNYIAVDIVESLINHHKNSEDFKQVDFRCLDIAKDDLPKADCVILRQVLQHLSNDEIISVVKKLKAFKYLILTEHLPQGEFESNKDIISGQGIRLKKNSGVNLLLNPFNLKVVEEKQLLSYVLENNKGKIVTTLYKLF